MMMKVMKIMSKQQITALEKQLGLSDDWETKQDLSAVSYIMPVDRSEDQLSRHDRDCGCHWREDQLLEEYNRKQPRSEAPFKDES